jgi:uracil-DNA glycosylase
MSSNVTAKRALARLAQRAQRGRDCAVGKNATQAVFGEGPVSASLFFIGEQAGD